MKTIIYMSFVMALLFAIDYLNLDHFAKWFGLVYVAVGAVIFVKELRNGRR